MKTYCITFIASIGLVLMVAGFNPAHTQVQVSHDHDHCGYHPSPEEIERLEANIQRMEHLDILRSGVTYYVPIKIHSINRGDGTGGIRESDIINQMCILNENFAPYDIQFFLRDQSLNFINNNAAFNNASAATAILLGDKDDRALNVYFAGNITQSGDGGFTLGYYDPTFDWVVMRNDRVNSPFVLSHEVGHFFSLQHTFLGWEPEPWDENIHGNPVTQVTAPNGFTPVELVNGSNCSNAADRICDTPPDYNFGLGWSAGGGCGPFNIEVFDRNNDLIVPMQDNYMSYFLNCDGYEFTPTQVNVMKADFLSPDRSHLREGFGTPPTGVIDSTTVPLSPENNGMTQHYDEVTIVWEEVPNATFYYLEISNISFFGPNMVEQTFVSDNSFTIEGLDPLETYYWRVRALNDTYFCGPRSSIYSFTTSDVGVSVDNVPESEFNIRLLQNPVLSGERPSIIVNNNYEYQDFKIELFSVNGQLISSENKGVALGHERIQLNTGNLRPGMYYIRMVSNNVHRVEPLIVQ